MIEGLKLTFSGEELRKLLEERIAEHNRSADHWRWQQSRTPESQTKDEPLLLLPPKPGSIEQEEYEERTAVGFHLRAACETPRRTCVEQPRRCDSRGW